MVHIRAQPSDQKFQKHARQDRKKSQTLHHIRAEEQAVLHPGQNT